MFPWNLSTVGERWKEALSEPWVLVQEAQNPEYIPITIFLQGIEKNFPAREAFWVWGFLIDLFSKWINMLSVPLQRSCWTRGGKCWDIRVGPSGPQWLCFDPGGRAYFFSKPVLRVALFAWPLVFLHPVSLEHFLPKNTSLHWRGGKESPSCQNHPHSHHCHLCLSLVMKEPGRWSRVRCLAVVWVLCKCC